MTKWCISNTYTHIVWFQQIHHTEAGECKQRLQCALKKKERKNPWWKFLNQIKARTAYTKFKNIDGYFHPASFEPIKKETRKKRNSYWIRNPYGEDVIQILICKGELSSQTANTHTKISSKSLHQIHCQTIAWTSLCVCWHRMPNVWFNWRNSIYKIENKF